VRPTENLFEEANRKMAYKESNGHVTLKCHGHDIITLGPSISKTAGDAI